MSDISGKVKFVRCDELEESDAVEWFIEVGSVFSRSFNLEEKKLSNSLTKEGKGESG